MAEHYDVIIIGTGRAGGPWPTPGALGQADPATGARRLPPAGEGELGSRVSLHQGPLHLARLVAGQGRQGISAGRPLLRRGRDEALWRRPLPLAPR